jgi:hypothetical protein
VIDPSALLRTTGSVLQSQRLLGYVRKRSSDSTVEWNSLKENHMRDLSRLSASEAAGRIREGKNRRSQSHNHSEGEGLTTLLSRHSFFATVLLLLAAVSGVFGQQSSGSPERTKREFMALAIDDINNRNKATVEEQKRIEAQGGKAPLFVALPVIRPFGDWDYY